MHGRWPAIAIMAFLLVQGQAALAWPEHVIPLFPPASNTVQQGFVRIINHSHRAGTVNIYAIDDSGERFGPVSVSLNARATVHFNSMDLEKGNPSKGWTEGIGDGQGDWRLEMSTDLEVEPLAYIRTAGGFLTSMRDVVTEERGPRHYRVPTFNPGSNLSQQSRLRLINPNDRDTEVTISGLDDMGMQPPGGEVRLTLPAGEARTITAQQLESGHSTLSGRLGDGTGKWQLFVSASRPVEVMSLLLSPDGSLTNLSRTFYENLDTRYCHETVIVDGDDRGTTSIETAISLGELTGLTTVRARTGTVNRTSNQQDYYRFTLTRFQTVRIELLKLTEDADLYLLNADGRVRYVYGGDNDPLGLSASGGRTQTARSTNGGIANDWLEFSLPGGTYYILVQAKVPGESGDLTIGYQLRYSNNSAIPGRRLASAFDLGDLTSVAVVRRLEGRVARDANETCLFPHRHYRFTLTRFQTVRIELLKLTENADLYLLNANGGVHYVYGGDNDPLGLSASGGRTQTARSTNGGIANDWLEFSLPGGTYYIRVTAEASSSTISYQLRYSNDSAIPGRTLESAFDLGNLTSVAAAGTVDDQVNRTSNDTRLFHHNYYRFVVNDTRTIRIDLFNLERNADLYLFRSDGKAVDYSRNIGNADDSIERTLARGIYYIQVTAEADGTIDYRLRYGPGEG